MFNVTWLLFIMLIVLGVCMTSLAQTTPATTQAAVLPSEISLDLFLLIGQSNMAGRGRPEAEDQVPNPRVWTLDKSNEWVLAIDPIHFDKPQVVGVGPGVTFGKALAQRDPSINIGLIPCAMGGSSIDQWKKDGKFYKATIARTKAALKRGKLKGILWHQGESDSAPDRVEAYPAKFIQLITDLRADLDAPNVPVIVGQLGEFRQKNASDLFNEMIAKIPEKIPGTACVSATGLKDKGDSLHFDAASERELGRRYSEAYLKIAADDSRKSKP